MSTGLAIQIQKKKTKNKKQIQENRNNPYDVLKPIQGTRI